MEHLFQARPVKPLQSRMCQRRLEHCSRINVTIDGDVASPDRLGNRRLDAFGCSALFAAPASAVLLQVVASFIEAFTLPPRPRACRSP